MIVMFGLKDNPVVSAIIGSLATVGGPVVLSNYVRHKGLAAQDGLYKSWGGKPTNQLLQSAAAARRDAWRSGVEAVSGHPLPAVGQANQDDDIHPSRYQR